ncbi:scavenger receptor cysteine-rich type 1 protein M130 isoform X10 [Astyanax mexicanus]|uniref:scavenger receptor cysteine-rich type 1 protein M130 isoform X10 n=2 Tax=Astyanax mexicanus TaxID=7994 RepID=UPI0020CB1C2B|nr:scavenger receptor cysteine-rich type 1 protein M130 isoform X10 [Astyanax mexicanus]
MDVETIGLICRELNCGRFKTERATKARVESAPNWLDDVKCRKHDSTLFHCPSSSWSQNNCDRSSEVTHITCSGEKKQLAFENLQKFFLFPNQGQCSNYMPIRLRGGEEICSGRLEVYHNAEWGSICADLWDIRDAQVVCRQLGCGPALSVNRRAVDGSGGGTIWMNRVKCRGNEIHLWDCPHSLKNHTDCSHSAGVTCADIFVTLPFSSETTTTYTTVPAQLTEKKTVPPSKNPSSNFPYIYPVSLLVLGSVLFLALVLLVVLFYQNRVLRRVISKARRKTLLEAVYEEINHKCVTNRYTKRGSFISEDQHSGYEDVDEELLSENYGEVYDDIIPAEESPHITTDSVRLVDGGSRCAWRVEVLHRGHWGTVCDDYWDMRDAAVVCRELGCGEAIDAPRRARFGSGSGPIWVEYANCAGSESSLKNCRSYDWGRQRCNHDEDAGAVCAEVRLVGRSRCSGRVEVLHGESWVTVCDSDFDQQDAEVVCRELGCGSPVEVLGAAAFGRGEGQVWSEELQCRGNTSQIHFCPKSSSLKHNCSHDDDVGLVCSESVRLVDGGSRCAGRVEVLHKGQWGTVCGDDWDMIDAAVVCRELGCGEAVDALSGAYFGSGSGPIWMDNVECRESESILKNCKSAGWGKHNCNHPKDAGVICSRVRLVGGSHCSGRVEVLHGESWVTVCDSDFNQQGAEVVCRELGCGSPVEVLGAAAFGRVEGQVWSEKLQCRRTESQIHFCPKSSSLKHNCSHDNDVGLACSGDKRRLVGGPHACSGRVEKLHRNSWLPVCDADFNQQDAEVVCSWELGCGSPVEVLGAAAFGRAEGQMWSEELQCRGNESHMYLCQTSPSLKPNCSHNKDVGLRCSGHTQARLMNGSDSCSGRVELQYLSEWGTVCDVSWDMRAASVLCAQLKCGSSVAVLGSDWFGEGSGRIWADVFDCQGNETHLLKCPISSWSRTACSHKPDAGVICSGSSLASHEGVVRLSGGMECEGEVEVFFRQDWRRVLLDSWSESEASVVCRQLGCGSVLNISSSSSSSPEHSYMCVTGFNCSGSEAHLRNCSSSQAVNCSSTVQLYITCSGTSNTVHSSIRLVGSGGDCAGRLEVFHSGSWGTVSDELWDIEDAQVVCRRLQCGVALSAPVPVPARFGSGTGPIWLNEVECEGNEASLWNCRYQLCGEDECGHKDDVGVVCSEYKEIRLTEGCEGNLEVYYNGTWGNVCVNGMTDETAKLICRELNCGRTGSESWSKARVESAPNWLDNVKCRKHDSTLWHCPSSSWGENRCDNRNEVACITCSENGNTLDLTNWLCDSSPHERPCSKHIPLRLRGGVGSCSGWLQVYHNKTWGSVCGDLWDIRDAQVICRQLGCGLALSANRRAVDGSGGGTIWMNRVKCRGNEIHLWDCPHSLKNHTDCSHSAGVTCGGFLYHTLPLNNKRGQMGHFVLQDSQPQTRRIILPQTPPPAVPSIYPVSLLVLGSVLFLALVLLVVLFYQNRVLRRVISKRRKTSAEPVYEEIDTRLIPKRITVSTEKEEPDNYDDVIVEQNSNIVMENMLEIYDDVMEVTAGHIAAVKVPPTSLHWTGYIFLESSCSDLQT